MCKVLPPRAHVLTVNLIATPWILPHTQRNAVLVRVYMEVLARSRIDGHYQRTEGNLNETALFYISYQVSPLFTIGWSVNQRAACTSTSFIRKQLQAEKPNTEAYFVSYQLLVTKYESLGRETNYRVPLSLPVINGISVSYTHLTLPTILLV